MRKAPPHTFTEHAVKRSKQRYQLPLVKQDTSAILNMVNRGRFSFLNEIGEERRLLAVWYDWRWLPIVYDPKDDVVVTVLPEEALTAHKNQLEGSKFFAEVEKGQYSVPSIQPKVRVRKPRIPKPEKVRINITEEFKSRINESLGPWILDNKIELTSAGLLAARDKWPALISELERICNPIFNSIGWTDRHMFLGFIRVLKFFEDKLQSA